MSEPDWVERGKAMHRFLSSLDADGCGNWLREAYAEGRRAGIAEAAELALRWPQSQWGAQGAAAIRALADTEEEKDA